MSAAVEVVASPEDSSTLLTSGLSGVMQNEANSKSRRYDRQIRIWGTDGQQRLESCRVCLLNAGPTGAEALKNLVLGGIASFTIVDEAKVCPVDLGNNFMVDAASLGEPRAKVVTAMVKELNDLVSGSYVEASPESMVDSDPLFFRQFAVVIATQLREPDVLKLESICREHGVVLLVVRSYGLVGTLRPSLPEHLIVESKPDNIVDDLRLYEPWPELRQWVNSIDMETADDIVRHHMPYVVLLVKATDAWKALHGGARPSNGKEQRDFKDSITHMQRHVDDLPIDSENFNEAVKAAFHTWRAYSIPSEVQALLKDEAGADESVSSNTADFWILVAALRRFQAHEGAGTYLPLDGSIPDMHATTEMFLRVQRLYREKAEQDAAAVEVHANTLLVQVGRDAGSISKETIKLYCKNARNLRIVRYRTIAQEVGADGGNCRGDVLATALASEGAAPCAALYVLLRAVDRFHAAHGRYPGCHSLEISLEEDMPALKSCAHAVLAESGAASATLQDDYVFEVVRFGASELHLIASVMGGIAAQETIKLVTGQFVTTPGTLVYNAMASTTAVLEL